MQIIDSTHTTAQDRDGERGDSPRNGRASLARIASLLVASVAATSAVFAQSSKPAALHIRGTVQSVKNGVLTVQTEKGPIAVSLPPKAVVLALTPSSRAAIKPGSFLGVTSIPGPAGSQVVHGVVVFPPFAVGQGAGSYPWDLPTSSASGSRMTNGTVAKSRMTNGTVSSSRMTNGTVSKSRMTNGTVKAAPGGDDLTVTYPAGSGSASQTFHLTREMSVLTFEPGKVTQLVPGSHVFVAAHVDPSGKTVADRTLVGKNGLVPSM